MPATLRSLLHRADLRLRLLTATDAALDAPLSWLHSSDLEDPTPFLADGQGLLTTGTQFGVDTEVTAAVADAYVARLLRRGVVALGFGDEVVRAGTPPQLVDACTAQGLALFEVPYETSFIAVAQANADAVAREANARNAWALAAQRAISRAAMRPDGLGRPSPSCPASSTAGSACSTSPVGSTAATRPTVSPSRTSRCSGPRRSGCSVPASGRACP